MRALPAHPISAAPLARQALAGGALAAGCSAAALVWRSRRDTGHAAAGVNATSHWVWPRRALRTSAPNWPFTATGAAIHAVSSLLWSTVYAALRARRPHASAAGAIGDAAAVAGVAAAVDLRLTPARFTPGFEQRVERASLAWIYGAFAAGLAAAGLMALRRR